MKRNIFTIVLISLVLLGINGCSSNAAKNNNDPAENLNRKFYTLNDTLDKKFVEPVAKVYVNVAPEPVRDRMTNFFDNLTYVNTISNDLLQGKLSLFAKDSARFIINSTVGIGGLFDPASSMGLERRNEDLGQTLAVWGASEGSYIMLPLLGPSSTRDVTSPLMGMATNPMTYLASVVTIPVGIFSAINTRANLLDATRMRDQAAIDPYTFVREAWRQQRTYDIHDGNPPETEGDEFDEFLNIESEATGILKVY
tara:strand:- start:267 stop:1028 length:762 start_codon:yes stop_codon:yes gene_type:complete